MGPVFVLPLTGERWKESLESAAMVLWKVRGKKGKESGKLLAAPESSLAVAQGMLRLATFESGCSVMVSPEQANKQQARKKVERGKLVHGFKGRQ
jgi:hypothetical protein